LDDTVWGGIVGDVGWENLVLGGHHHRGEAYVDFQQALKSMKNRGILLAIVSKNEEQAALEAIQHHPEMVLALEDFAGWRINWADKVQIS
jgi:FkbH-like protein